MLAVYSACTSIIYGLGSGMYASGVLAYCGVISSPGVSGKNFGFLYLIWAITGFLSEAISLDGNYFNITIMDRLWLMLLVAGLALTLANPDEEHRAVAVIKKEPHGNVINNIKGLSVMIPVVFSAALAWNLVDKTLLWVSKESGEMTKSDENIFKWVGYVFGPIGPIMFGILWDTSKT